MKKVTAYIFVIVTFIAAVVSYTYLVSEQVTKKDSPNATVESIGVLANKEVPNYRRIVVAEGLTRPWDVAVSLAGEVFFTEKGGTIAALEEGNRKVLAAPNDVKVQGEAGMMGLALDSDFENNRFLYTCFASIASGEPDIRLVRWRVNQDTTALADRQDIVTGIPYNSSTFPGRHSGCRPRMDVNGNLWVGTGDAAIGTNPQDPKSLGGKILRVDRNGKAVEGNLDEDFDPRIFSYGHRNVQGIALFDEENESAYGFSAEHGSSIDDEVNRLVLGNFGWDPIPGYTESGTPMTDTNKFPNAVEAVWSSGDPTIAVSGAEFIVGEQWGLLHNSVLLAAQKDQHVRALILDDSLQEVEQEFELVNDIGRVRSVVQAPNGDIYVTTDNGGGQDRIIRLVAN